MTPIANITNTSSLSIVDYLSLTPFFFHVQRKPVYSNIYEFHSYVCCNDQQIIFYPFTSCMIFKKVENSEIAHVQMPIYIHVHTSLVQIFIVLSIIFQIYVKEQYANKFLCFPVCPVLVDISSCKNIHLRIEHYRTVI